MKKQKILLTGPTGNMGKATLEELIKRNQFEIVVFSLPTNKDKEILSNYNNITIIYGDLRNYQEVSKAIKGIDIVLHTGALVSPVADKYPELAWSVNFNGTKNIVDALIANNQKDKTKLVYIGTVAETGNRPIPIHWGRIGDPINPSIFDYYGLSKIAGERYVIESTIKNWVSLRQTGILHNNIFNMRNGIEYHQPLNNHLEWVSVKDSANLLANICQQDLSKEIWGNCFNIGGGDTFRLTAYQFMSKLFGLVDIKIEDIYQPKMFALKNFHGQYYLDSDKLEQLIPFRTQSFNEVLEELKAYLPLSMKLMKYLPKKLIKRQLIKDAINNPNAPLYWIKHNQQEKIKAYLYSKEEFNKIPDWDNFELKTTDNYETLSHGYDESKTDTQLTIEDLKHAAIFRGGSCLSETMVKGDLSTKLKWKCSQGHQFVASPYLILKAGHWCQQCLGEQNTYNKQAKTNKFLAQVLDKDD
jgi:nucleoside-diphosphate-sugar epimerase